jgi:hypothetical protein
MLKLRTLIEENKEGIEPLKGAEYKVIMFLENKFGDFTINDIHNQTNDVLVDHIFETIMETLSVSYDVGVNLYYLYTNNIESIRSGDDSWKSDPERGIGDNVFKYEAALAKYLEKPYSLLKKVRTNYGLEGFEDNDGYVWAIGDGEDRERAINLVIDEHYMYGIDNNSNVEDGYRTEARHHFGERFICEFLYIPEGWKKELAIEGARFSVNNMSDDELIDPLDSNTYTKETKELSNRYYDLVNQIDILNEKIDNTTNDDEIEIYSEKIERLDGDIENIYDSAREIIEEEEYKEIYQRLTDDLEEWLSDYGYLDNGELAYREVKGVDRPIFPNWLYIDANKMRDELENIISGNIGADIALYDGEEHEVEYNGETYYIYQVD